MANWIFNINDYEEQEFALIPTGDHRVRISDVVEKVFNSGNPGYEITFEVSGYNSKLWFYLVLKADDVKKTNQNIGNFFNCFAITDPVLDHYRAWIGKVGAVRVKHEEYNNAQQARVAYCLSRKNQEKLPPAKFNNIAPTATAASTASYSPMGGIDMSELPFN